MKKYFYSFTIVVLLMILLIGCKKDSKDSYQAEPIKTYTLNVFKDGDGSGNITSLPEGINCGNICYKDSIYPGTSIALIASPDSGSLFAGWNGHDSIIHPSGNSCSVKITNSNRSVTAMFNKTVNFDTILKWKYSTGAWFYYSSPAIGSDGTIYIGNDAIHAINPDGSLKWRYGGENNFYSPSIGVDGTIFIQDGNSSLHAIDTNGNLKWIYTLSAQSYVGQVSPAIGPDGTIYVGAGAMYAINPDGSLKWMHWPGYMCYIRCSPAIASDGTIYVGVSGGGGNPIWALNPDGTLKWEIFFQGSNAVFSSPAISSNGIIYGGVETSSDTNYIYAINPDGTLLWRYDVPGGRTIRSSPAIGVDGIIYIGTKASTTGSNMNADFLALNPNGTLKWKYTLNEEGADIYCSPAIGLNGMIYFGAETGFLYALNPDGTLAWKYDTKNGINWTSPAIADDGTIYIGNNDGNLFALNSDSFGLATSSWPKFRHDNKNTGKFIP